MQEIVRKLLIYVLFYEYCAFFCELCDFSWIVRSDAIWGRLCEIAPSHNIRRPYCRGHTVESHSSLNFFSRLTSILLKFCTTAMINQFSGLFKVFRNVFKHGILCLIYYWKRFTTYLFRRFLFFVVSSSPGSSPTFPQGLPFHLSSAQPCLWGFLRINIQSTFRPFVKDSVFNP